jgi:hypothetical protein
MSRTSCIPHPEGERLILIRKWQLEACQKDACAAALLNLFEYWHNIKLEQRSQAKSHNDRTYEKLTTTDGLHSSLVR